MVQMQLTGIRYYNPSTFLSPVSPEATTKSLRAALSKAGYVVA